MKNLNKTDIGLIGLAVMGENLAGKILYLLDRNDPVNSAENGYGPTIKLIQVNLGSTNKREQELFFHEIHNRFLP